MSYENREKPNLFDYAASELSQDAFIAWLMEWANPQYENQDIGLHSCGTRLIQDLLKKHGKDILGTIENVEIKRQEEKIDLLILVNGKYVILIEDKTNTADHSEQLKKYLDKVKEKYPSTEGFEVVPIYFKTGDQSDYKYLEKKGYKPFKRKEFLNVLENGIKNNIQNSIFCDYFQYLENIEYEVSKLYKTFPVLDWDWRKDKISWMTYQRIWIGFFIALKEALFHDIKEMDWEIMFPTRMVASWGFGG